MKTKDIIENIDNQGGFDNFRNWNVKEIATWVRVNFGCSYAISINVAKQIN